MSKFQRTWTDEQEQLAAKLWKEGYSAGVIAGRIGKSRNSIIGKIRNLGIMQGARPKDGDGRSIKPRRRGVMRSLPVPRPPEPKRKTGPQSKSPFYLIGKGPDRNCKPKPVKKLRMNAIPSAPASLRVPFAKLGRRRCLWPTHEENGSALFCGAEAGIGEPYCPVHMRARTNQGLRALRSEAERSQPCA